MRPSKHLDEQSQEKVNGFFTGFSIKKEYFKVLHTSSNAKNALKEKICVLGITIEIDKNE